MRASATRASFGPLDGLKVLEIGAIGPSPFCAMLLADMGADVLRVDRPGESYPVGPNSDFRREIVNRGRRSAVIDLKSTPGRDLLLDLVEDADVLLEGYRPGTMERLGLGPDDCAPRNPALIYGRMTGYGQTGPLANKAGHDLNYVAASGVLSLLGLPDGPPSAPLNLVGDMGGGGMLLGVGVLAALWERERSGLGQVIDAAMVDGAALLATSFFAWVQSGAWSLERGRNLIDGGAPYYGVYRTLDEQWLSVAALESRFYDALIDLLDLDRGVLPDRDDSAQWDQLRQVIADAVRSRTLDEWLERAAGFDACVAAVLSPVDVLEDAHHLARGVVVEHEGVAQPAPAPRFSRTPSRLTAPPCRPGEHTMKTLQDWGVDASRLDELLGAGVLAQSAARQDVADVAQR